MTIAYDVAGDGPAVLLLHEGVADRRMWHAQVAALAAEWSVVAPDLRGFGETPHASGPFSHADDLRDLLDELEIDEAAVVGGSFGGRVALDFALAFPARVSRLVLCPPVLDDWEPSAVVREGWRAEEAAYEAGDLDGATEVNLELWVDGPNRGPDAVDPQVRELVRTMQRHAFELPEPEPPPEERRPVTDAAARLGEVRVPTLVVVGAEDVPDFLELADRAAAGIAGARKVVIADAAHVAPLERPEEFNRVLLPFLRGDR